MDVFDALFTSFNHEDGYDEINDPTFKLLLTRIQGNLLKFHGRAFSELVFLELDDSALPDAKQWIKDFFASSVTTADVQLNGSPDFVTYAGFTHRCYERFGISSPDVPDDGLFEKGMAGPNEGRYRWDPRREDALDYGREFDVLIVLAGDDPSALQTQRASLLSDVDPFTKRHVVETGNQLFRRGSEQPIEVGRRPPGQPSFAVEHFGYRDGVSQPLFYKSDVDRERGGQIPKFWNAAAPLDTVLVADGRGYGSFMAFQKLEQDVPGFQADTVALAQKYKGGGNPSDAEIADAGAKVVGRYIDGTPAIADEAARQGKQGAFPNDFDFDNVDVDGVACPFHAHVRRMNPRHALNGDPAELSPRIARRGIPYGAPGAGPDIGLLFMSMQAGIHQFDQLLKDADQKDFPRTRANNAWGTDTIIGRPNALVDHHWRLQRYVKIIHRFERHVTFLGGGYFHFPSMAFWEP